MGDWVVCSLGAIVNRAAVNILELVFSEHSFAFLKNIYIEVQLHDHNECLHLALIDTTK